MSLLAPREPTPGPDRPQPLRPGPTLAGALVAFSLASLAFGSMCAAPTDSVGSVPEAVGWLFVAALWVAMAACIYGANQAWLGRDRSERLEIFVLSLGLAVIPFFVALVVVGHVATSRGWSP